MKSDMVKLSTKSCPTYWCTGYW